MQTKFITPFLALLLFTPLGAQKIEPTHKHVAYGAHKDMKLNFWKIESKEPTPLLVHIHGGGWLGGKKNETSVSRDMVIAMPRSTTVWLALNFCPPP